MSGLLRRLHDTFIARFGRRHEPAEEPDALAALITLRAQEKRRIERILSDASDAVMAAIPPGSPRLHERRMWIAFDRAHDGACYVFETEADHAHAREHLFTLWLQRRTHRELLAHGYPQDAVATFTVSFATRESHSHDAGTRHHYSR